MNKSSNKEINQAVHEALGGKFDELCNGEIADIGANPYCFECHKRLGGWGGKAAEHFKPIPAYTEKPDLWWPLVEECKFHIIPHTFEDGLMWCVGIRKTEDVGSYFNYCETVFTDLGRDEKIGRAVCLAYLKMKEMKQSQRQIEAEK